MFAVFGTVISAVVVGGGVYFLGQVRASYNSLVMNNITMQNEKLCSYFRTDYQWKDGSIVHHDHGFVHIGLFITRTYKTCIFQQNLAVPIISLM